MLKKLSVAVTVVIALPFLLCCGGKVVEFQQIDIIVDPDGGGGKTLQYKQGGLAMSGEMTRTFRDDLLCSNEYNLWEDARLKDLRYEKVEFEFLVDEQRVCVEAADTRKDSPRTGRLVWTMSDCEGETMELRACLHEDTTNYCPANVQIVGECQGSGVPLEMYGSVQSWRIDYWNGGVKQSSSVGTGGLEKFRFNEG